MVTCQAGRPTSRQEPGRGDAPSLRGATSSGCSRPADAVEAIEACFRRMARRRGREPAALPASARARRARGDGRRPTSSSATRARRCTRASPTGARFVVTLFRTGSPELVAVIDADKLGQLRTGAASAVAAKHLARPGAATLGVIGCGWQAEIAGRVHPRRRAGRSSASSRTAAPSRRCASSASGTAASPARATATRASATSSSPSPARPIRCCAASGCSAGALVCAVGANDGRRRELDNVVLERATLRLLRLDRGRAARVGRPDRADRGRRARLARGARAAGGRRRRARRPAGRRRHRRLQVERARGVGRRGRGRRRRARAASAYAERVARGVDVLLAERLHDLGPVEQARLLLRREPVLHVAVLQDLGERAAAAVLAREVRDDLLLRGASA